MNPFRIGIGHDIHGFVAGRPLFLGGVHIPHDHGLLGHSDADALLHAIMDALLGAIGQSDIGHFFPNTDPAFKNISSLLLLEKVIQKVHEAGYDIGNIDSIIHCEKPKIGPHRETIRRSIAKALGIHLDQISVKAGTNEGFDAVGRGEALVCQAVALLVRSEKK